MELLHIKSAGGAYVGTYSVRCPHGTTIEAGFSDALSTDPALPRGIEQASDLEAGVLRSDRLLVTESN